jgi:hypothetical protein
MDLYSELLKMQHELDISVKQLRTSGKDYATAYTNYRMALAKKLVEVRNDGTPVSLCSDLARGDREVAKYKFEEISKEAIYKANLESINSLKLRIKIIENQIEREWGGTND